MKKAFAVLALMGLALAACGRQERAASPEEATLQPAAESAAPAANAPAPSTEALEKAATSNQESAAAASEEADDRGESRLERVAALPEAGQLPAGKWKAGTHYNVISPAQPTAVEPGQVEVLEVFWYGCPHCFALEPTIAKWEKGKPSYVKFTRVPVMWGPVHRAHARLFYTLEALGKLDELHDDVFNEIHQRNNFLVDRDDAQTLKLQLAFAKAHGISEADFNRAYNSFGVNAALQRAEDLTRRYRVEGVPEVIVNGKFQTDVGMAGGPEQLVQLIGDLAAGEKRR